MSIFNRRKRKIKELEADLAASQKLAHQRRIQVLSLKHQYASDDMTHSEFAEWYLYETYGSVKKWETPTGHWYTDGGLAQKENVA